MNGPSVNQQDLNGIPEEEIRENLPQIFREYFGDAMSLEGMLSIMEHFGGQEVYISPYPFRNQPFKRILNEQDFAVLLLTFSGEYFRVPFGTKLNTLARNRDILRRKKQGESVSSIAMRYGLRSRTVYRIIRQHEKNDESPPQGAALIQKQRR